MYLYTYIGGVGLKALQTFMAVYVDMGVLTQWFNDAMMQ
jgi:hypothetical protein